MPAISHRWGPCSSASAPSCCSLTWRCTCCCRSTSANRPFGRSCSACTRPCSACSCWPLGRRRDRKAVSRGVEMWSIWGGKMLRRDFDQHRLADGVCAGTGEGAGPGLPGFRGPERHGGFTWSARWHGCFMASRRADGWLVALLMAFHLEWSPIIYGVYAMIGVMVYGLYLRKLGRELTDCTHPATLSVFPVANVENFFPAHIRRSFSPGERRQRHSAISIGEPHAPDYRNPLTT